jgi:hypothetical protein
MRVGRHSGAVVLAMFLALSSLAEECAVFHAGSGIITPPFVVSNGCVCQTEAKGPADSGRAVYYFTITNAGSFVLQALVNAPGGEPNSFLINVDAEPDPAMIWEVPVTAGFTNQLVSWRGEAASNRSQSARKVFNLSSGGHQLIIRGNAGTVQLARIAVLRLPPPPTGLRVTSGPDS